MNYPGLERLIAATLGIAFSIATAQMAHADLLYSASLKNGAYGSGFIVDTFASCADADGSSCGDGNLSNIGITNSAAGVSYTSNNAVINYSLGLNHTLAARNLFRAQGTVSVWFNADRQGHISGQPFTDNYGFNQFNSGQGAFGAGMSRDTKGTPSLNDDEVSIGWNTWHNNVWYGHTPSPVLASYNTWHNLGLAWGGPANDFEIWIDGVLMSAHNLPPGVIQSWGASNIGLGSAYNFALGEIHERAFGNGSVYGVMFADLNIWNEYRAQGDTVAAIPEPETYAMMLAGFGLLGFMARRRRSLSA